MKNAKKYFVNIIKITLAAVLTFTVVSGIGGVYADEQNEEQKTEEKAYNTQNEQDGTSDITNTDGDNSENNSENNEVSQTETESQDFPENQAPLAVEAPAAVYTVTFVDYDGTQIGESQEVTAGGNAVAPVHPVREGFQEDGWDVSYTDVQSNLTVTAVYKELVSYTVTVNYIYKSSCQTAAQPFVAVVKANESYTIYIETLPTVTGYHPVDAEGNAVSSPYTVTYDSVNENKNIDIYYVADGTTAYTVNHYLEGLSGTYELEETETLYAETGSSVTATAKQYIGFSAPNTMPSAQVAADKSTVIDVKYSRNEYLLSYVTNGSSIEPQILKYGTSLTEPEDPTREGYNFAGWFTNAECTEDAAFSFDNASMPASNLTLYAGWTAEKAPYKIVVWLETADSKNNSQYDYATTLDAVGIAGQVNTLPTAEAIIAQAKDDAFTISKSEIDSTEVNKTKSDATVTVAGDGSSVANVYLNRKEYTILFKVDPKITNKNYTISYREKSYSIEACRITANYGADIETEWNTCKASINSAYGDHVWVKNPTQSAGTANPVIPPIYTMKESLKLYYIGNGSANHVAELWVENLDNTEELDVVAHPGNLAATYYNENLTEWKNPITYYLSANRSQYFTLAKEIRFNGNSVHGSVDLFSDALEGFTWIGADLGSNEGFVDVNGDGSKWVVRHYYSRNSYSIVYNICSVDSDPVSYKYQADISNAGAEPEKPASLPEGSTFAGWYTTPTFDEGTEFDFTNATMPAHDLKLYAKWIMPTYTVSFDTKDDDVTVESQTIVRDQKASEPEAPVREGYIFSGWYEKDSNTRFSFTTAIERNIELEAHWIENTNISYTVKYLDADGNELHVSDTISGNRIGSSVTATAVSIDNYIPDVHSKSITIKASGNEIIFTYSPFTAADYTVYYVNQNGENLRDPKTVTSTNQHVTENYRNIPGYIPNYYQQSLDLSQNAEDNVITFVYTIYDATASYKVQYYLQNVNGIGYTLDKTTDSKSSIGNTVYASVISYAGYTVNNKISLTKGVVFDHEDSENGLVLRVYYDRNKVSVTFAAGEHGTLNGTASYSVRYGTSWSQITVPAPVADTGYKFNVWTPTLKTDSYEIKGDLSFTASFVKDDAQWFSVTYEPGEGSGTEKADTDILTGTSYTVKTAASLDYAKENYTFIGWKDASGKSVGEGTVIESMTGNVVLTAQYKEDSYANITYYGNADSVTGTVTDSTKYYKNNLITVKANGFTNEGYTFSGWNTQADGKGTSYAAGDVITSDGTSAYTLYAQWTKDASKWITVNYKSGTGSTEIEGKTYSYEVLRSKDYTALSFDTLFALKDHFHYTGWTADTGSVAADGTVTFGTESQITLTAQFTEDAKYKVTYDGNGGTGTVTDSTLYYGNDTAVLKNNGYTAPASNVLFLGWSTEQISLLKFGDTLSITPYQPAADYTVTADVTFYAVWAEDTDEDDVPDYQEFSVTYLAGEGTGTLTDSNNYYQKNQKAAVLSPDGMSKTNYHFAGWKDEQGTTVQPGYEYTMTHNVTLTAQWEITKVNYVTEYYEQDLNADTYTLIEKTDAVSGNAGTTVNAVQKTFAGFTFYAAKSTASAVLPNDSSSTVVLKMYYTRNNYSIKFVDENGTTVLKDAVSYPYGTAESDVVRPSNPTKASDNNYEYVFSGWNPTVADVTENRTYTAVYTAVPKLHLSVTGGTHVYDGNAYTVTASVDQKDGVTLSYSKDGINYSSTIPSVTNVSERVVRIYVKAEKDGYVSAIDSATVQITPATMTVEAAADNSVYDGQNHTITLKVTGPSSPTILYGKNSETEKKSYSDAGTYTYYYIVSDPNYTSVTGTVTLTITKRPVTLTADSLTISYNETPVFTGSAEAASAGRGLVNDTDLGTISYVYVSAKTEIPTAVGTYKETITPVYTENKNYDVTPVEADFTIQALNTLAVNAENVTVTYDTEAHTVTPHAYINGAVADDAVITYKQADGSYTSEVPSYINKGTYTVEFKANKTGYAEASGSATITINPKAVKITVGDASDTYTGTAADGWKKASVLVDDSVANKVLAPAVKYDGTVPVNAKTYENVLTVSYTESDNYTVTIDPGNYTINKAKLTVTSGDYTGTYDAKAHSITLSLDNAAEGNIFSYHFDYDSATSTALPEFTDTGTHIVSYTITSDNYETVTGSNTVTINPVQITVSAKDQTLTYNGTEQTIPETELEISMKTLPDGSTLSGTLTNNTITNVSESGKQMGVTLNWAEGVKTDNYNITYSMGTITMNPAEVTVTANPKTMIYGDAEVTLDAEVSAMQGTDSKDLILYTLTRAAGTDAGTYDITVNAEELQGNYKVKTAGSTLTISPKEILVTASAMTKVYGDADPAYEATADGLVGEDKLVYTFIREEGENVGTYKLTVTAEENPNYTISYKEGSLEITYRTVTVTAVDRTITEGDAAPDYDAVITGRVKDTDPILVAFTVPSDPKAGVYTIKVTGREIQGNYKVVYVNGTLTVNAPAVIIPDVTPEEPTVTPEETVTTYPTNPGNPQQTETPTVENGGQAQNDVIVKQYGNVDQPAFGVGGNSWALINLILTALTLILAIIVLFSKTKKDDEEEEKEETAEADIAETDVNEQKPETMQRKKWLRVFLAIAAAVEILVFIFTEDITKKMILFDRWTWVMVLITMVGIISFLFAERWTKKESDDDDITPTDNQD